MDFDATAELEEPAALLDRMAGVRLIMLTAALVTGLDVVLDKVLGQFVPLDSEWGNTVSLIVLASSTGAVLWFRVVRPLHRQVEIERSAAGARQRELAAVAASRAFDSQLRRALEMAATELAAYDATERALEHGAANLEATLLLSGEEMSGAPALRWSRVLGSWLSGSGCQEESAWAGRSTL